jgi:hypothetical protein
MPSATYFVQECPTCGRRLQIRVEYLGRKVACQHCQGTFVAADPNGRRGAGDQNGAALRRANELLDSVAQRQQSAQPPVMH